jgi:cytochrome c oxidase cbb3-type subunit III
MSGFWSTWVVVLACVTAGLSLFLFVWGITMRIPTNTDGTTGHVWAHGVLREGVRPLPVWWMVVSLGAFIFAAVYLYRYPGFGSSPGKLAWTSQGQHQGQNAANGARLEVRLASWRNLGVEQLATNAGAVSIGHRLYLDNCAACHGSAGHGNHAVGAPDLTDADWLYGGDGETILKSILDGRTGMMPPQGPALGHSGTNAVASYVVSRSGTIAPPDQVAAGKTHFDTVCAACHGVDGRGNPALGAPNLFDNVWLYGGDIATVVATVRDGRSGVMPAWRARLTSDEARLIAAWVIAQGSAAKVVVAKAGG